MIPSVQLFFSSQSHNIIQSSNTIWVEYCSYVCGAAGPATLVFLSDVQKISIRLALALPWIMFLYNASVCQGSQRHSSNCDTTAKCFPRNIKCKIFHVKFSQTSFVLSDTYIGLFLIRPVKNPSRSQSKKSVIFYRLRVHRPN